MTATFSVNVSLPATPEVEDQELYREALKIYNAIRSLAVGLDEYTDGGLLTFEVQIASAQATADINSLRKEVSSLREELAQALQVINWAQPGEIGATTPNNVTATALNAETLKATGAFGVNGAAASGKITVPAAATDLETAKTLANALRNLVITFGLGAP